MRRRNKSLVRFRFRDFAIQSDIANQASFAPPSFSFSSLFRFRDFASQLFAGDASFRRLAHSFVSFDYRRLATFGKAYRQN